MFVFQSCKSLTNVTEVPKDWNDPSLLLSLWLYRAHIAPAMIKTNTGQRGEEKETTRETVVADLKEGVLRQKRSESDKLISTYTEVHPIKWE